MKIDMHTHTKFSDGTQSIEEVINLAKQNKVDTLAITDHDTIINLKEHKNLSEKFGISILPGIEITTNYKRTHILGYGILDIEKLDKVATTYRDACEKKVEKFTFALQENGYDITLEEVIQKAKNKRITFNSVYRVLMAKNIVSSYEEADSIFKNQDSKYDMVLPRISVENAISIIKECGGIPVLAHPCYSDFGEGEDLKKEVEKIISKGIEGIEAHYARHTKMQKQMLSEMARKNNIYITAGTDYHGYGNKKCIGITLSEKLEILDKLL